MDGVTEYSLNKTSESNQLLKGDAVKNRRAP